MNEQKEKTVNQIIHEWAFPDKCWHEPQHSQTRAGVPWEWNCSKCGKRVAELHYLDNPAYDSEDSPRKLLAEVEAKVFDSGLAIEYVALLTRITLETEGYPVHGDWCSTFYLATASASNRAKAIVSLIQENL
jgi:hypothetical protein